MSGPPPLPPPRDLAAELVDRGDGWHVSPEMLADARDGAGYDWAAYERTCAPDRQLDGLGDLCMFLGGSWSETPGASSFTGELLKLIVKAQATPERFAALAHAFPREVIAWHTWMGMSPTPTAAELCARLTTQRMRISHSSARTGTALYLSTEHRDLAAAFTAACSPEERRGLADYITIGLDVRHPLAPLLRRLRDALEADLLPADGQHLYPFITEEPS